MMFEGKPAGTAFFAAYAKAKYACDKVVKRQEGSTGTRKYTYAKLSDILDALEPSFNEHGLYFFHESVNHLKEGIDLLRTTLVHIESLECLVDERLVVPEKPGAQGRGAYETYMKKQAILGLSGVPTEDDDGQDEQRHIERRRDQHTDLEEIKGAIKQLPESIQMPTYRAVLKQFGIETIDELPKQAYATVKQMIRNAGKK